MHRFSRGAKVTIGLVNDNSILVALLHVKTKGCWTFDERNDELQLKYWLSYNLQNKKGWQKKAPAQLSARAN